MYDSLFNSLSFSHDDLHSFSASMVSTVVARSFLRLQTHITRERIKAMYCDGDASFFEDDGGAYVLKSTKPTIDDSTMRSGTSFNGH